MSKELIPQFRWKTMTGETLTISEMETSHIFNAMKMCFNHLATHHGGAPVWFVKSYRNYHEHARKSPKELIRLIVFFIIKIEERKDLPEKYKYPYHLIIEQIRGHCLPRHLKLLPEVPGLTVQPMNAQVTEKEEVNE